MKMSVFGSKVIGKKAREEQDTFRAERRHKFGPLVLGDKLPAPGTSTPAPDSQELRAGLQMSVERLKEVLSANPYLVTNLLEKELYRPRGARVEALKVFLDAVPPNWKQGKALKDKIQTLLRQATAESGVVYTEEAKREAERTAMALRKKGFIQQEDGSWAKADGTKPGEDEEAE